MDNERLRYYRLQALRGNSFARKVVDAFDPDQPRDPDGKWGGGGGGKGTAAYHNQKATEHAAEAAKYISNEHHSAHMNAAAAHAVAAAGAHTTPEGSRSQQEAVQKAESLSEKANAIGKTSGISGVRQAASRYEAAQKAYQSTPLGHDVPEHIRAELRAAATAYKEATKAPGIHLGGNY